MQLSLQVMGGLRPSVDVDRQGVSFLDGSGAAILRYAGLQVSDARGQAVPARLAAAGDRLYINVEDRSAIYPLTIDPLAQQAYLKASPTDEHIGDVFGSSVSISGDTLVLGAPYEDGSATGVNGNQNDNSAPSSGAAYVFVRNGSAWSEQAYLKASNTDTGDLFGSSIAISGDTLVVGATSEFSSATGVNGNQSDNSAASSGAAYVFVRSGSVWSQQAYLKASNTDTGDLFGSSIAISGDTLVVGATSESSSATGVNGNQSDNSAAYSGAAYVFVRSGSVWSQQAYLKASNTNTRDYFGQSVALSGDTLVVGAFGEDSSTMGVGGNQDDNSALDAGAAYVFVRNGNAWSQQAYLKASNTDAGDEFGWSVAISGDMLVVGADAEASSAAGVNGDQYDNSAPDAGAAYVFIRSGSTWSQQAYLKASNTGADDDFGSAVAISGETLVVGARNEASNATGVNGDQADNSADQAGAGYVFTRSGAAWSQQAYLKASNTGGMDMFGSRVAISGEALVVGAPNNSSPTRNPVMELGSTSYIGAAYVFSRSDAAWSQQAGLKASSSDGHAGDQLGWSTAISGDTLVVGVPEEDSNSTDVNYGASDNSAPGAGAAYVFVRSGSTWRQQSYLKAANTDAGDHFGYAVAISGDSLVVGAWGEDSSAEGVGGDQDDNTAEDAGAAYLFTRSGAAWSQQAYLKASNTQAGDGFGWAVTISGATLLIGAPGERSGATGVNGDEEDNSLVSAGAAYVFVWNGAPGASKPISKPPTRICMTYLAGRSPYQARRWWWGRLSKTATPSG